MMIVCSAAFDDPYSVCRAAGALRCAGIPCSQQLGRRAIHRAFPCPTVPHRSVAAVRPVPPAPHPAAVLNVVASPSQLARARKIIRRYGGREI